MMVVVSAGALAGALPPLVARGAPGVPRAADNRIAGLGGPVVLFAGSLTAQEPAALPSPDVPLRAVAPVAPVRPAPAPAISGPPKTVAQSIQLPQAEPVGCARLDDAKISWLLGLVAKTKAANPGSEAVADRLDARLRGALGSNMCASQAQQQVSVLCAEPAIFQFMQRMVKQLLFFVRPLVGDPCQQDLSKAAQRWLP